MSIISQHLLTGEEKDQARKVFHLIDKDYNGNIDQKELHEGFKLMKVPKPEERSKLIFKLIDLNGDGTIEFSEFCTLSLNWNSVLSKHRIMQCFNIIDKDHSGCISYEELKFIFIPDKSADDSYYK